MEIVSFHMNAAIEEFHFNTHISLAGSLPFQVFVTLVSLDHTSRHSRVVERNLRGTVSRQCCIRINGLATRHTPASAYFQVAEKVEVFNKFLLREPPAHRH
eukprot:Mycagemm_TRINITY_DN9529_c0_g3::TRINITY_DN9529_c0_g3_i1::g.1542::m.1542 type:complete len:101 gc:universal TRINITY_DN9529_c0_g3_i1:914-612(-)